MADVLAGRDEYRAQTRAMLIQECNNSGLTNGSFDSCVHRSAKSPRPAKLSSDSAEIEQWVRPD